MYFPSFLTTRTYSTKMRKMAKIHGIGADEILSIKGLFVGVMAIEEAVA